VRESFIPALSTPSDTEQITFLAKIFSPFFFGSFKNKKVKN
jgi:hypothetical protein